MMDKEENFFSLSVYNADKTLFSSTQPDITLCILEPTLKHVRVGKFQLSYMNVSVPSPASLVLNGQPMSKKTATGSSFVRS